MTTDFAVPPMAARLDRREEARQDRLVTARIQNERAAALAQARIAEREADRRMRAEAATEKAARRAAARADRADRRAALAAWAGAHVVDLLFVPVIGVPALLSWTAMASFGMRLYGPAGVILPAFSEGAMWAFAAATTITRHRHPGRSVWHLRTGIAVFAIFGAALNFLHGLATPTALFPGLPSGYLTGAVMCVISVAGVIAHQLITAGPRGKDISPAVLVVDPGPVEAVPADEPDTPAGTRPDSVPDTADSDADTPAAPKRTPARTRRGQSKADRARALKDKHPDMSTADIAGRLEVDPRTVRRYLTARPDDAPRTAP
jgi:hypothetical protein